MLQVNFVGKDLLDIYQHPEHRRGYYPPGIVKNYIKVVTLMQMEGINDVTEINKFGNYKIGPKKGDMRGIRSARLNDGWRLEFRKDDTGFIQIISLEEISRHYND